MHIGSIQTVRVKTVTPELSRPEWDKKTKAKTNNRKRVTKESHKGTIRLDCALICLGNKRFSNLSEYWKVIK